MINSLDSITILHSYITSWIFFTITVQSRTCTRINTPWHKHRGKSSHSPSLDLIITFPVQLFGHAFSLSNSILARSGSTTALQLEIHLRNRRETRGQISLAYSIMPGREESQPDETNDWFIWKTSLDDDAAPHGRVIKYLHCHRFVRYPNW